MSDLPRGWRWATSDEVVASVPHALTIGPFGSDLKVSDYRDDGVPLVFVRDIRAETFGGDRTKYVDQRKATQLARHRVLPGDLLITKMGDPPGDTAVYPDGRPPGIVTADCIKLTVDPAVAEARYLRDALRAPLVKPQILEQTAGVAQQKLSLERFRTIRLPLPPLNEQRRIVTKLDALRARSRRARAALDSIPPLLEKLRQSVLAAAFRGDLTKDWRAKHPDVEPASELLKRIRVERRRKWEEAELAKMVAKGKPPKDDRWKEKYEEPQGVDTVGLPELPPEWCWATVEQLCPVDAPAVYGIIQPGEDTPGGVPYVRPIDVREDGSIDRYSVKRASVAIEGQYARARLKAGDIILSIVGTIGKVSITPAWLANGNITQSSIRLRPPDWMASEYLRLALLSPQLTSQYDRHRFGNAVQRLNVEHVRALAVPVPPIPEQAVLVLATEAAMKGHAAVGVAALRVQVDALERSILAKAFRGELVPQDPSDTPVTLPTTAPADPTPRANARRGKRGA